MQARLTGQRWVALDRISFEDGTGARSEACGLVIQLTGPWRAGIGYGDAGHWVVLPENKQSAIDPVLQVE